MTRKQAFLALIQHFLAKNDQITANKLQEILNEIPYVKWTESSIKDLVEQFMIDFSRLPTATDFGKKGLPSHPVVKHTCKLSVHDYMAKNFPDFYVPIITKRQAMERAINSAGVDSVAAQKIKEVLMDYPFTKWNTNMINDGIQQFYDDFGRLPSKEDFSKIRSLPYMEIFCTYFSSTRIAWFKEYFPKEYAKYLEDKENRKKSFTLIDFSDEYKRIRPLTEDEFDLKRNKSKICCSQVIMRKNGISKWSELLASCGLKKFEQLREPQIAKLIVEVI